MSLFVTVLRGEPCAAGLQAAFQFGGLGRCKPHGSFPSPALLPQDADETQGEHSKDEGVSGAQTAESQVRWDSLSLS